MFVAPLYLVGVHLETCLYPAACVLANQQRTGVRASLINVSTHSLLRGIYFKLVFSAKTKFCGTMPIVYIQENFSTQEKDLWPTLLDMHLSDMTLEYHWKLLGLIFVSFCLHGLWTRAVRDAGPEEGQHSIRVSGFTVDGEILGGVIWSRTYPNLCNYYIELW